MFVFRTESQLLLLIRVLYDHLPRYLVFLPVTEDRLSRSFQHAIRSMSHELMSSCERQKASARREADGECSSGDLSAARLQADTDSHVLKLLDVLY